MSSELLHIKKSHDEAVFDKLVMDEYDFCLKEIKANISNGRNNTVYTVTMISIDYTDSDQQVNDGCSKFLNMISFFLRM